MPQLPPADAIGSSSTNAPGAPDLAASKRRAALGRLGVALLIGFAAFLLAWGCSENQSIPAGSRVPNGLEIVSPANGSTNVPSQSTISADLQFGNTGVLVVAGKEIPLDQLDYVRATGLLSFTPGPGKDYSKLPGDSVRVTVIFWPEQGSRERDAHEYTWYFNVL